MSERREAEERASLALVEAGLDELFDSRERASVTPPAPERPTSRGAGWRSTRFWSGLATAAAVMAVVGVFVWYGIENDPAPRPNRGAATNIEDESAVPMVPVKALSDLDGLASDLAGVDVSAASFDDAALRRLVDRCPHLEVVRLFDVEITDAGLVVLQDLPRLRDLRVPQCKRLTDAGLAEVLRLEGLDALDLTGFQGQTAMSGEPGTGWVSPYSKFTSEGLATLGAHAGLRRLNLSGTRLENDGLASFAASAVRVQTLDLSGTMVTHVGMRSLIDLESLRELRYEGQGNIDDQLVEVLAGLPQLRRLKIGAHGFTQGDLTSRGVDALIGAGHLEVLHLGRCPNLTPRDYAQLGTLSTLRELKITGLETFAAGALGGLSANPGLAVLDLGANSFSVTEAHASALATGYAGLRRLVLPDFPGDESALAALRDLVAAHAGHLEVRNSRGVRLPTSFARIVLIPSAQSGGARAAMLSSATVVVLDGPDGRVVDIARPLGFAAKKIDMDMAGLPARAGSLLYETGQLDHGTYRLEVWMRGHEPRAAELVIDRDGARLTALEFDAAKTRGSNWLTRTLRLQLRGTEALRWDEIAVAVQTTDDGLVHTMGQDLRECEATDIALSSIGEIRINQPVRIRIYRPGCLVQVKTLDEIPLDKEALVIPLAGGRR